MFVSIIGYYEHVDGEVVQDSGLWMVYESDDLEAVKDDFTAVAHDLLPNYGDPEKITFRVDLVQPLSKPPKMWRDRVVQKL